MNYCQFFFFYIPRHGYLVYFNEEHDDEFLDGIAHFQTNYFEKPVSFQFQLWEVSKLAFPSAL